MKRKREKRKRREILILLLFPHFCSFAQLIEDTFSITLALQIALNTVMISITLLQVRIYLLSQDSIRHVLYTAVI